MTETTALTPVEKDVWEYLTWTATEEVPRRDAQLILKRMERIHGEALTRDTLERLDAAYQLISGDSPAPISINWYAGTAALKPKSIVNLKGTTS